MNGTQTNGNATSAGLGNEYTDHVIESMGPKTDARLKQVMTSLIRHVHDFAREVDLTVDEWMAGVEVGPLDVGDGGRPTDALLR